MKGGQEGRRRGRVGSGVTGWPATPTNLTPVDQDHVVVARGRDCTDVTPLKGIYAGRSASSELCVSVEVTRLT